MNPWWTTFYDRDYIRIWQGMVPAERTEAQARGIWELLELRAGSRVLDAACGYGRLSLPLARMGASVLGVDQSPDVLAHAEKERGELPPERLRYLRHDLREPLSETGFDAAFNTCTPIGFGTEAEDLAIFKTLREAVRPGGLVLTDTMHRDAWAALHSRGRTPWQRLPDGTLVAEESCFDPFEGRIQTTWHWSGPHGHGQKSASWRIYNVTELIALLRASGLEFISAHRGCSKKTFRSEGRRWEAALACWPPARESFYVTERTGPPATRFLAP